MIVIYLLIFGHERINLLIISYLDGSVFLLGDRILVAPVVEEGATSRDIYLPMGTWLDERTNTTYSGPTLLRSYSAPLHVIPYFVKILS